MTGLEILGALGAITGLLGPILASFHRDDDLRTTALRALSEAVTASEKYVAREKKQAASYDANYELTNLWHLASIAFGNAGHERMQELCQIKGDFWLNPDGWSDEEITESGIRLVEMRERLNRVLQSR